METEEIAIADIHKELARLWRESASHGEPAAGQPAREQQALMRVMTMNLVVAGAESESTAHLAQTLMDTTLRHPCRAIVINSDDARQKPAAWVSMVCHTAGRVREQVCSEQLILMSPPDSLHDVFTSVAGLLVADLPTFVWWRGRLPTAPQERERLGHLLRLADRVLVDSAAFGTEELSRMAQFAGAMRRTSLGDLNWARLTPWRAAVAHAFDPDWALQTLPHLAALRIYHRGSGDPPAETRLMAGWVRSRVGHPMDVEYAAGNAESLELFVTGMNDEPFVTVGRPTAVDDSAALSEELRVLGRDTVFEQALTAAIA